MFIAPLENFVCSTIIDKALLYSVYDAFADVHTPTKNAHLFYAGFCFW